MAAEEDGELFKTGISFTGTTGKLFVSCLTIEILVYGILGMFESSLG